MPGCLSAFVSLIPGRTGKEKQDPALRAKEEERIVNEWNEFKEKEMKQPFGIVGAEKKEKEKLSKETNSVFKSGREPARLNSAQRQKVILAVKKQIVSPEIIEFLAYPNGQNIPLLRPGSLKKINKALDGKYSPWFISQRIVERNGRLAIRTVIHAFGADYGYRMSNESKEQVNDFVATFDGEGVSTENIQQENEEAARVTKSGLVAPIWEHDLCELS